ncbi:MAG: hypothetical protein U5Q03_15960 [Bacteroidota bacterium]|nr:hypothetical protein [Bacteroidota bacterium]
MEGRNHLFKLVEEFNLCQKLCGLYDSPGACFCRQIKECNGACVGEENPEIYNERVNEALDHYAFPHKNFYLLDYGRHEEEKAVVKIENGKYIGFGFINLNGEEPTEEDLSDVINSFSDNKDVRQIIRSYIKQKSSKNIFPFG